MLIYMQMIETEEERDDFQRLYQEYRNLMFYVANQILHNEHDAEDAVHDAFMKIAKNMKKISDPVCPKTRSYVVIIVESCAIDMLRKKNRHPTTEMNEEITGLPVTYEGENVVAECLLKLPGRYREVLLLKHDQGYSIREIAKIMGITEANAGKLEQRAKKKLRELCEKEGIL